MDGRGLWRTAAVAGLGVLLAALAPVARADETTPAPGTPDATAAARTHFAKAKELYQQGAYREAIAELEAARALDPNAKDLVFNLAVVHEKLGEIDKALDFLRTYAQMDLDAAEMTKAQNYIKRLEGAKAEIAAKSAPVVVVAPGADGKQGRTRGRIDAATISVGTLAVGCVAAGIVFGVMALVDQPTNFVSGTEGNTFQSLQNKQDAAHRDAVVADILFGSAIAATAATLTLYFARYKDAKPEKTGSIGLTPTLGPSGAGLLLGGSF